EAASVFAKSLVKTRDFDIDTILAEKKGIIRKSGILEFYQTDEKFNDVGGLEVLKSWLKKRKVAFSRDARDFGLPAPKGILLIGVPGCGKSLTAKAIGAMWHMPLLRLDVGKVFGSLVGSSEENMRKAIKTAEAVAPSILWLDELEKGFSGSSSSGQTDGGTTARVFGTFITWLQEKQSAVFVIATANDVSALPPELLRKGRFDEIFFVDLPSQKERGEIFKIHITKKKRDPALFDYEALIAASQQFAGSEIEQAVVSALYDCYEEDKAELTTERLVKSIEEIIPLAYTMKERIDHMRDWSKSRARRASLVDDGVKEEGGGRKLEI
ncbi:MAG: SpoVK/Ycf46/Vps4 family AAA+-type ATPase, partial [Myxococcota bacterium]